MASTMWRRLLLYSVISNELLVVNGIQSIPLSVSASLENLDRGASSSVGLESLDQSVSSSVGLENLDQSVSSSVGLKSLDRGASSFVSLESLDESVSSSVGPESVDQRASSSVGLESRNKGEKGVSSCVSLETLDQSVSSSVGLESLDKIPPSSVGLETLDQSVSSSVGLESLDRIPSSSVGLETLDQGTSSSVIPKSSAITLVREPLRLCSSSKTCNRTDIRLLPRPIASTRKSVDLIPEAKPLDLLPDAKSLESNAVTKVVRERNDEDLAIVRLFALLIKKEFRLCDLVVASDRRFFGSPLLQYLVSLPNYKQVIAIDQAGDLKWVDWASPRCHGVIILISDPAILAEFAKVDQAYWDYNAKVVIAGLTERQLLVQPENRKLRKTTHILGIVKRDQPGQYSMYMNALYWGGGLKYISTWRGQQNYKMPEVFPDKIGNIRKHVINVTMFEFPPNIMFRRDANGTITFRYGFEVDIIYTLAEVFNFTFEIKDVSPTELWGKKQPDGTFTGLVGRLGRMEADFGVGNVMISISSGRVEFIEFSSSYLNDEACLLARVEPPLPRWQAISLPFTLQTWIAVLIGLIVTGPVMYVIARMSAMSGPEHSSYLSPFVTTLNSFGLLVRQGLVTMPSRPSNKIFILFLLFYVFIITTVYGSNLTAFLTITRQPPGVETFRELYESKLDLYALGPFLKSVLANSESSYHRALADRFYIMAFPEIRKHVLSGKGVMINGRGYLEFARDQLATAKGRPRARLVKVDPVVASITNVVLESLNDGRSKECFAPFSVATAFQIYSPLRDRFSKVLERLLETGILRRWYLENIRLYQEFKQRDLKEGLIQPENIDDEYVPADGVIPLGIDHLQGAFIILAFGCLLSLLSFIVEVRCPHKAPEEWDK